MKHIISLTLLICLHLSTISAQKSYTVQESQNFSLSLNALAGESVFGIELQGAMHLKRGTTFYIGGGLSDVSFSFDQFLKFGAMQRIVSRSVISIDTGLGLFLTDTADYSFQIPLEVSFRLGDRLSINTGVRFGYTHVLLGLKYHFTRDFINE